MDNLWKKFMPKGECYDYFSGYTCPLIKHMKMEESFKHDLEELEEYAEIYQSLRIGTLKTLKTLGEGKISRSQLNETLRSIDNGWKITYQEFVERYRTDPRIADKIPS